MTQEEIIEMARQAGFVDYELDDGTTNAFDKRYEAFTKLVAEKAIKEALAQPEQEPVAYIQVSKTGNVMACAKTGDFYKLPDKTLLYTSPQPAPVQQEPVAWMVWAEDNVPSLTFKKPSDEYVFDSLYTAPPQLKPLTHEQRFDLLTKFEPYKNKWEAPSILIDMVEATHNIKENT